MKGRRTTEITPDVREALIAILDETGKYLSPLDQSLIIGGYDVLSSSLGQKFGLNQHFLMQSLDTILDLARLGLRGEFLACAALYYPLAAGAVSLEDVEAKFGEGAARVARAMMRIARSFESEFPWYRLSSGASSRGSERLRKPRGRKSIPVEERTKRQMAFLAIAGVPETAILKVVDQLHRLKWAGKLVSDSSIRKTIAQQSIYLHAPVADTFGLWSVKWEIEDVAFGILDPDTYKAIARDLEENRKEREAKVNRAKVILANRLSDEGVKAEVTGRPKHIYSIYNKLSSKGKSITGKSIQEINDLLGLRVIVESADEKECYTALNILFRTWPPAEGVYEGKPFRDWIENPKDNGYQSIHTTVIFEMGYLEVQIRTRLMHDVAEYGASAHWLYKKVGNASHLPKVYQRYRDRIAQVKRMWKASANLS